MEKLSHTSHKPQRSSWETSYNSYLATATDRKIRNIIHTRKSGSFLETSYAYAPQEKLQLSDSMEVSSQLSVLKTLMDRERFSFTRGDVRLARLQTEGVKIQEVVTLRKSALERLRLSIENIESQTKDVLEFQSNEVENQVIYLHVLDRMRTTLVYLKRKYRKLEFKLHGSAFEVSVLGMKSTKAKENKLNAFQTLTMMKDSVAFETNAKQKELTKVEKDVKKRKELSEKRLENKHRQEEMMEKAMIEDKSAQLEEMREKFLLHFMWDMVSSARFTREQVKWKRYEDAFFKIKIATGIQDIPLLVEKYLTKEQIYSDFLNSVKKKEIELFDYRERIENMQTSLDKLNEVDPDSNNIKDKAKHNELRLIRKEVLEENQKMKQLLMTKTKIKDWCLRLNTKLQKVTDLPPSDLSSTNIRGYMDQINLRVKSAIQIIRIDEARSKNVSNIIKTQNIRSIVDRIPTQNRIKPKVSDILDLGDLSHIEAQFEEHNKRHK